MAEVETRGFHRARACLALLCEWCGDVPWTSGCDSQHSSLDGQELGGIWPFCEGGMGQKAGGDMKSDRACGLQNEAGLETDVAT